MMPQTVPLRNGENPRRLRPSVACLDRGSNGPSRSIASGAEAVGPIQSVQNPTGIEQTDGGPSQAPCRSDRPSAKYEPCGRPARVRIAAPGGAGAAATACASPCDAIEMNCARVSASHDG